MIFLMSVALVSANPHTELVASAPATATVRVLRAVRLKLDGSSNAGVPAPRASSVRGADGSVTPARIIDFQ